MNNKIIRILHFLLFFNSLLGILAYPSMAIISIIIYGLGVPGFVFLFLNGISAFRKKTRQPKGDLTIAIAMIVYNFMIYNILSDFTDDPEWTWAGSLCLNPWNFPLINIVLSVLYAGVASIAFCISDSSGNNPEKGIPNEDISTDN